MVLFPTPACPLWWAAILGEDIGIFHQGGDHLVLLTRKIPDRAETGDLLKSAPWPWSNPDLAAWDYFKVGVKGIARVRLERFITDTEAIRAK